VVLERGAVLMRPSQLERRTEVAAVEAKLGELGIPILGRIEAPGLLDGADILLGEGIAYVGIPQGDGAFAHRSNAIGRAAFAEISGLRVIEVPVAARAARLSSVATLIDASTVVLGAHDVDHAAFDGLAKIVTPVGEELGAGMLVIDEKRVLATVRFRETPGLLKKAGITVDGLDLWEFGKLGFSPASLVLALSRR
jgi:N-dimethylarginine dimethylaminohydrolase